MIPEPSLVAFSTCRAAVGPLLSLFPPREQVASGICSFHYLRPCSFYFLSCSKIGGCLAS